MHRQPPIRELIVDLIARACNVSASRVTPDTTLQQLGIDSITLTNLAAHLSALYDREWDSEDLVQLLAATSVGEIINLSQRVTVKAQQPAS